MKNRFKGFKLKVFTYYLGASLLYPFLKGIKNTSFLTGFSDGCFILALFFLLCGIVNSLVLHGDFDITAYIAKRSLLKQRNQSFDEYTQDKKEEREDKFNYPLLNGFVLLLFSLTAALL